MKTLLLIGAIVMHAPIGEKCIEVEKDEESAEISFYVDGTLVMRRIMLLEAFEERYKDAVAWQCNWSCDGIHATSASSCQSSSSSSGGQSTMTSSKQK